MNNVLPELLKKIKVERQRGDLMRILILGLSIIGLLYTFLAFVEGQRHWRAVFLANNQVYFGKFTHLPFTPHIRLRHIYYLQMTEPLQQAPNQINAVAKIKLIKLGNELHGPRDMMVIPKDQILFWENLKKESELVKAIQAEEKP